MPSVRSTRAAASPLRSEEEWIARPGKPGRPAPQAVGKHGEGGRKLAMNRSRAASWRVDRDSRLPASLLPGLDPPSDGIDADRPALRALRRPRPALAPAGFVRAPTKKSGAWGFPPRARGFSSARQVFSSAHGVFGSARRVESSTHGVFGSARRVQSSEHRVFWPARGVFPSARGLRKPEGPRRSLGSRPFPSKNSIQNQTLSLNVKSAYSGSVGSSTLTLRQLFRPAPVSTGEPSRP